MQEVYLDNDVEFEYRLRRKATTTGTLSAATGVSSITVHYALTDGGEAIAGTSTALSERSATPGLYFGILDKAALNTALGDLVNTRVYEVFVVDGDSETSEPVLVKGSRRPA
jgi:hypothetical protein